jgi:hypothetical protein
MDSHWKRVEKLEQRAAVRRPDTFDLETYGDYLSEEDLDVLEQAMAIMSRLEQEYQEDRRPEDIPTVKPPAKVLLTYATDEELLFLEQATAIQDRAIADHQTQSARAQPANGQTLIEYKQKIRGRPWKV